MPPSLDDWLPEDHEARFISDVVENLLDLSSVYDSYTEASGAPPYDPTMMLKLLLYAYSTGVTALAGDGAALPCRRGLPVAERQRGPGLPLHLAFSAAPPRRPRRPVHPGARPCAQRPDWCSLGRVALDGTKLRASASKHKAMSHDRMGPRIEELEAQVAAMLAEAEAVDSAEDEEFGEDRRGDELPPELATKEGRLAKLRAAKEAIEAEAREKAAQKAQAKATERGDEGGRGSSSRARRRPRRQHEPAEPSATSPTPSPG